MPRLVIEDGARSWNQEIPAGTTRVRIGRALTNTLVIEDGAASREHCAVELDPSGEMWLVDLQSRNGTRLNGQPVERVQIQAGDRIEIGSTSIRILPDDIAAEDADPLALDPLTRLSSYPAFVRMVERLLERRAAAGKESAAAAASATFSVAKLDIDYLGLMNDMFGLRSGDELIRRAGVAILNALAEVPGEPPRPAREAGGKFLLLLPRCGAGQARELAELVRAAVAAEPLPGMLQGAALTLSAGVAEAAADEGWDGLLRRAEGALAEAKRSGRDRVIVAGVPSPAEPRRPGASSSFWSAASAVIPLPGTWSGRGGPASASTTDTSAPEIRPLVLTHAGQSILGLVAQALGSDLELEALLRLSLQVLIQAVRAERGCVLLREPGGALRLRVGVDAAPGAAPSEAQPSQRILGELLETRAPVVVSDAQGDPRFQGAESVVLQGLRAVLAVPIPFGQEVVGVVWLERRGLGEAFAPEDRDLALAFARLVAGPVRRELLHQAEHGELERIKAALSRTNEAEGRRRRQRYAHIIGDSAAMKRLFHLLDRVAETAHPVLIHGESGTGKELVASAVHYAGPRADKPFVAESCAAFSDALLESELFGHMKGSFTGAERDRVGLIEAADGGTLFLDEIGEMSERMQAKLLRVLQEGEVRPVGAREVRKVDVRLLCASNKNLAEMARAGKFREDLYYRVAVMTVEVPPLRERREDIPLLVDHFIKQSAEADRRDPPTISREALQLLVHNDWPGNVRELENEVKKLVALAKDVIKAEHLSPRFLSGASPDRPMSALRRVAVADGVDALMLMIERGKAVAEVMEEFEKEAIGRLLKATQGNRSETARRLGLSRPGLLKKMKRYGIE